MISWDTMDHFFINGDANTSRESLIAFEGGDTTIFGNIVFGYFIQGNARMKCSTFYKALQKQKGLGSNSAGDPLFLKPILVFQTNQAVIGEQLFGSVHSHYLTYYFRLMFL